MDLSEEYRARREAREEIGRNNFGRTETPKNGEKSTRLPFLTLTRTAMGCSQTRMNSKHGCSRTERISLLNLENQLS